MLPFDWFAAAALQELDSSKTNFSTYRKAVEQIRVLFHNLQNREIALPSPDDGHLVNPTDPLALCRVHGRAALVAFCGRSERQVDHWIVRGRGNLWMAAWRTFAGFFVGEGPKGTW